MTNNEMMNGDGLDDFGPRVEITVRAKNLYQLREILEKICYRITNEFDAVNAEIHSLEREQAFTRYLRTGKFE